MLIPTDRPRVRVYARQVGRVRAMQFDGRVASFDALLAAFPGRLAPHPHRDDALLVIVGGGRRIRIETGDWVTEDEAGTIRTWPDDQFRISHHLVEAIAA